MKAHLTYRLRYLRRKERDALVRRLSLAVEMRVHTYSEAAQRYKEETGTAFRIVARFAFLPPVFYALNGDLARLHAALSHAQLAGSVRALGETNHFAEE